VFVTVDLADELAHMIETHPRQPVVIDHCLLPKAGPQLEVTIRAMERMAKFPGAIAKISFAPLGSAEEYPFRDMHEPLRRVLKAFGPDRCVWGSNFPCEFWMPGCSYTQHLRLFTEELELSEDSKREFLGNTGYRLWFSGSGNPMIPH
jgi:L-fuconolactonase